MKKATKPRAGGTPKRPPPAEIVPPPNEAGIMLLAAGVDYGLAINAMLSRPGDHKAADSLNQSHGELLAAAVKYYASVSPGIDLAIRKTSLNKH